MPVKFSTYQQFLGNKPALLGLFVNQLHFQACVENFLHLKFQKSRHNFIFSQKGYYLLEKRDHQELIPDEINASLDKN